MAGDAPARLAQQHAAQPVALAAKRLHLLEDGLAAGGRTPPTTTFPISPPAWQPTTVNALAARIRATIVNEEPASSGLRGSSEASSLHLALPPGVSRLQLTGLNSKTSGVTELLAFLGVSAIVIATPGPDTALTIRNTLMGGRRAGIFTALGVSSGQAIWTWRPPPGSPPCWPPPSPPSSP